MHCLMVGQHSTSQTSPSQRASSAEAMSNLGVLLEERGAIAEAESWYRLSAEARCPAAMDNLGWLLDRRGETVEAETWHRQAAEARGPRRRAEQDRPRRWHSRATRPPGGPADAGGVPSAGPSAPYRYAITTAGPARPAAKVSTDRARRYRHPAFP